MEKNNQPLILGAIAIGAVLIIALALIFTRGSDETTTETTVTDDTSENREDTNTGENDENDQSQPTPDPTSDPQPEPTPEPEPSNGLPSNWLSLTSQQKTDLNPFDCDVETQVIWATDGTCHDKVVNPSSSYRIDAPFTYQFEDGLEVRITSNFNCQPFIDVYNNLLSDDESAEYADKLIDQFYKVLEVPKTEATFLRDAALYQECSFEMVFENTGADYHYKVGTPLRRHPSNSCNFSGPVSEPRPVLLIDQSGNEHPSLSPYSLIPFPPHSVTCAPIDRDLDVVFETGDVVESKDGLVWLLSNDTEIQQMQVTLGNRGVESVVLDIAF